MALEQMGLDWVNKGVSKFVSQATQANKAVEQSANSIEKSAKKINQATGKSGGLSKLGTFFDDLGKKAGSGGKTFSSVLDKMGISLNGLTQRFASAVPGGANFVNALQSIPPSATSAAIAVGAVAAAVTAFVALGVRGAGFQGIIDGFKQTGVSLETLRQAANGTIADIQLMTTANTALAGSTGLVRQEFGEKLPALLEIARAQARSTGQSVDFLFESLVTGIKRSSPLLIDNTGLVLKVGEANEAYAEKIGKTVEQLTAQEKQVALLEATLEAGRLAVEQNANAQETAADKLARIGANITNIFDRLAYAIQPAFEVVVGVVDSIIGFIADVVSKIAPYIQAVAQVFAGIASFIGQVFGAIFNVIRPVLQSILDFLVGQAKAFAIGGARMFGAFVTGVAFVINRSLLPLIAAAAQGIADLLVGQSPPPKGPLSKIDKGGENVMLAWMEGFAGVSIAPVEQVSQDVADAMGNIAQFSLAQVETRILQLDKAVQPFIDQLDIVKARFESIAEPAKAALDAIDRQVEKFQQALADGDQQAAETIKNLDARRSLIQDQLDFNQAIVDQAQIQLALKQAEQAEERALLNIRKQQIPVIKKQNKEASKGSSQASSKAGSVSAPKKKTGTGEAELPPVAGVPDAAIDPNQFGANAGFIEDLSVGGGLFGDTAAAFLDPLLQSGELDTTNQYLTSIRDNIGRINEGGDVGGIGGRISQAFSNIPDAIGGFFTDAVSRVEQFLFGEGEGSLSGLIASLPQKIPELLASLPGSLGLNLLTPFGLNIESIKTALFGDAPESLSNAIKSIPTNLKSSLIDLTTQIKLSLIDPFNNAVVSIANFFLGTDSNSIRGKITKFLNSIPSFFARLLGEENPLYTNLVLPFSNAIVSIGNFFFGTGEDGSLTLQSILQSIPNRIGEWVGGISEGIQLFFAQPFQDSLQNLINWLIDPNNESGGLAAAFFTLFSLDPSRVGSIAYYVSVGAEALGTLKQKAESSLQGVGLMFWNIFVKPIIQGINWLIGKLNEFLAFLSSTVNSISDFIPGVTIRLTAEIGKISEAPPDFLQGAADGGLFTGGMLRVGERGEELIAPASKIAVFPNQVTRALDSLNQVFAQPQPQMVYSGAYAGQNVNQQSSIDNSMSNQFINMRDNQDLMQRLAIQRVRSRRR